MFQIRNFWNFINSQLQEFSKLEIANIKIEKDESFDNFIFELFIFIF